MPGPRRRWSCGELQGAVTGRAIKGALKDEANKRHSINAQLIPRKIPVSREGGEGQLMVIKLSQEGSFFMRFII